MMLGVERVRARATRTWSGLWGLPMLGSAVGLQLPGRRTQRHFQKGLKRSRLYFQTTLITTRVREAGPGCLTRP